MSDTVTVIDMPHVVTIPNAKWMKDGFKNITRLLEISPNVKVKVIFAKNRDGHLKVGKPVKLAFETAEDALVAKLVF
jgi:hypothetical protein